MSLCGKLEGDVEIMSPADTFYEIYSCRPYHLSKCCPNEIAQNVELLEGQWGKEGSIFSWYYTLNGNAGKNKVVLENVDYKTKSVSYKTIEGNIKEHYKRFKISLQVTPREEGSLAHCTVEYEKLNENVSDPKAMLQVITDTCKHVDANLTQANSQKTPVMHCN